MRRNNKKKTPKFFALKKHSSGLVLGSSISFFLLDWVCVFVFVAHLLAYKEGGQFDYLCRIRFIRRGRLHILLPHIRSWSVFTFTNAPLTTQNSFNNNNKKREKSFWKTFYVLVSLFAAPSTLTCYQSYDYIRCYRFCTFFFLLLFDLFKGIRLLKFYIHFYPFCLMSSWLLLLLLRMCIGAGILLLLQHTREEKKHTHTIHSNCAAATTHDIWSSLDQCVPIYVYNLIASV